MSIKRNPLFPVFLFGAVLAACGGAPTEKGEPLLVFAAASLRDVVTEIGTELERTAGAAVEYNFAGSNTLAQQIVAAPVADVFLSADGSWVDFLDEAGRTVPGTRRRAFSNRLVVVAHRDAAFELTGLADLARLDYRFLALADPEAVPAGRYAKAYLAGVPFGGGDLYSALEERVVPALDVRAALAFVESDPEILGIVYRTDAMASRGVRVVYEIEPRADVDVVYWATLVDGGRRGDLGRVFLDFLESPAARAVAARYGFLPPDGSGGARPSRSSP